MDSSCEIIWKVFAARKVKILWGLSALLYTSSRGVRNINFIIDEAGVTEELRKVLLEEGGWEMIDWMPEMLPVKYTGIKGLTYRYCR